MGEDQASDFQAVTPVTSAKPARRSALRRIAFLAAVVLIVYLVTSYLVIPRLTVRYAHRHPAFDDIPNITLTGDDRPGDPLNVALIGSETELKKIMLAAKWYPADPLTLKSCLEIAEASVFKRSYDEAPVSNLFLYGRKEDLAFEKPVDDNPRERHHARRPLARTASLFGSAPRFLISA